jgi:hypothetical protein
MGTCCKRLTECSEHCILETVNGLWQATVLAPPIYGWKGFPFQERFQDHFGLRVVPGAVSRPFWPCRTLLFLNKFFVPNSIIFSHVTSVLHAAMHQWCISGARHATGVRTQRTHASRCDKARVFFCSSSSSCHTHHHHTHIIITTQQNASFNSFSNVSFEITVLLCHGFVVAVGFCLLDAATRLVVDDRH